MYTSLVLLGSTTASQRALAAAQAAELGGKEKTLTGFRGFLVTACGIQCGCLVLKKYSTVQEDDSHLFWRRRYCGWVRLG